MPANFRFDPQLLPRHFQDHGQAVGALTAVEYEEKASAFWENADPTNIHQDTDSNGDQLKFNDQTNEFVVVSSTGTIRTYHIMDPGRNLTPLQRYQRKAQR